MSHMNWMSLRFGTPRMTHGSAVNNVAAMMGSAEFFDPLICTVPRRGFPPVTIIFSIAPSLVKAIYCVSPLLGHSNDGSFVPLQVLQRLRDFEARADKQLLDSRALPGADFQRNEAA